MQRVLRNSASKARDFWIDHIWTDVLLAGLIVAAHGLLVQVAPLTDLFSQAAPGDRRAVYAAAAVVVSLLGSFSAVAIGQLGSAKGARAESLKRHGALPLAKSWRSIFRAGMLAALAALFALLMDPSVAATPDAVATIAARWIFELALVHAAIKFLRLSTLFYAVIGVVSEVDDEPVTKAPAPTVDPAWRPRS